MDIGKTFFLFWSYNGELCRKNEKTGRIYVRCCKYKFKCPASATIAPNSSLLSIFNQNHNHTLEDVQKDAIFKRRDLIKTKKQNAKNQMPYLGHQVE